MECELSLSCRLGRKNEGEQRFLDSSFEIHPWAEGEQERDWTGRGGTSRSSIMPQEEHAIVISSLGQIMDAGPRLPHKVFKGIINAAEEAAARP